VGLGLPGHLLGGHPADDHRLHGAFSSPGLTRRSRLQKKKFPRWRPLLTVVAAVVAVLTAVVFAIVLIIAEQVKELSRPS
jgi:hypothetical protein